jgi:F0F1-type ATP synthase epsilon subunit
MSGDEASALRLKIITPKRLLADVEAESVSIPSLEGEIGILPGHRPLVVGIGKGRVARVEPDEVLVMTEEAEDEGPGEKSA